jgi:hypothetical protein
METILGSFNELLLEASINFTSLIVSIGGATEVVEMVLCRRVVRLDDCTATTLESDEWLAAVELPPIELATAVFVLIMELSL